MHALMPIIVTRDWNDPWQAITDPCEEDS